MSCAPLLRVRSDFSRTGHGPDTEQSRTCQPVVPTRSGPCPLDCIVHDLNGRRLRLGLSLCIAAGACLATRLSPCRAPAGRPVVQSVGVLVDGSLPQKCFRCPLFCRKNIFFLPSVIIFYRVFDWILVVCDFGLKFFLVYFINLFIFAPSIEQKGDVHSYVEF